MGKAGGKYLPDTLAMSDNTIQIDGHQYTQTVLKRCRDRLRDQHRSDGMSTLEAVAAAVAKIEEAEAAKPLEKLYDELVRRIISLRWGTKNPTGDQVFSFFHLEKFRIYHK